MHRPGTTPNAPARRALLGAALLAIVSAACADLPTAVPAIKPVPAESPTSRPVFQGVFLGDAQSGPDDIGPAIEAFGARVGKGPALVKTFLRLGDDFGPGGWAGRVLRAVDREGSTNFVALDLRWPGAPESGLLDAIAAGRADAVIRRAAAGLRELGAVVLLEPGWEMNGDWDYPWQGAANGGASQGPAAYVAAWRHLVDVFRAEGAGAVRWVFSPVAGNPIAGEGRGPQHWNWYGHYYPGDDYVDYMGVHGFNGPSVWNTPFLTFQDVFDSAATDHMLSDLNTRYPGKPILISEFACEETPLGDKAAWVREAYSAMARFPGVVGAIWFDARKEADWRVDSSAASLGAYKESVARPWVRSSYDESGLG